MGHVTYARWVGEGIGSISHGSGELDAMARLEGSGGIGLGGEAG